MNRFKCPACGGNQYTACDTAEWCIYCGHRELVKMDKLESEERKMLESEQCKMCKNNWDGHLIKARDETEEELDWANIRELIRTCLDLDEWKYSWHMLSLDYTDPEIAVQIKNIIKHKIQRREKELKMLKSCLKIINDIKKGGE